MKPISVATALLFTAFAVAEDGILGTKADSMGGLQAAQPAGGSWIQMMIALVIVLVGMKYVLPKMLSPKVLAKLGGRLSTNVDSAIQIQETASFPGGHLHLVKVNNRTLLLGTTATSIATLADFGTPAQAEVGDPFMDYLDRAVVEVPSSTPPNPQPPQPVTNSIDLESSINSQDALRRISKLLK